MQDIALFIQHHWQLNLALFVVLFLLMILELLNQKRNSRLSPQQAVQLINRDNAVVVDIRAASSFSEGHIIDAISLPAQDIKDKWKKLEKYKAKPVILTCATGAESTGTAALLLKNGFTDVRILSGGVRAWQDASLPLIKG